MEVKVGLSTAPFCQGSQPGVIYLVKVEFQRKKEKEGEIICPDFKTPTSTSSLNIDKLLLFFLNACHRKWNRLLLPSEMCWKSASEHVKNYVSFLMYMNRRHTRPKCFSACIEYSLSWRAPLTRNLSQKAGKWYKQNIQFLGLHSVVILAWSVNFWPNGSSIQSLAEVPQASVYPEFKKQKN